MRISMWSHLLIILGFGVAIAACSPGTDTKTPETVSADPTASSDAASPNAQSESSSGEMSQKPKAAQRTTPPPSSVVTTAPVTPQPIQINLVVCQGTFER